jgi:uncharacterized protein YecT (DUF1311 family)
MSSRRDTLTSPPPRFPALTKTQKTWVADRKRELESALQEARDQLDRGEGRPFDVKRITAEIKRRRRAKTKSK